MHLSWMALVLIMAVLVAPFSASAGVPITLYRSFAGNLDFVGTEGSLRVGDCGQTTSGTGALNNIPANATITAAYLYWAGSSDTIDSVITLTTPAQSNLVIPADRTFQEDFVFNSVQYDYYSGFADVTTEVATGGNGDYTVSNLSFETGSPYNNFAVCLGGWSLVVIYELASEPLRVVNVFDGFEQFRFDDITLTPNNFVVPVSPRNGKLGHISWEGDVGNSSSGGGFSEALTFEGALLSDAVNPPGEQFNSVSNSQGGAITAPGVDFDIYDLDGSNLLAGQTSGDTVYSSGGDRVLLSVEIFSTTNTPVADLVMSKTDGGAFGVGQNGTWTLSVSSNGPSTDPGPIVVTDTLPAGTSFVSASGTNWSCSESSGVVTCSNPNGIASGATLPPISLEVAVSAAAQPSIDNTATVAGTIFDNVSGNNSDTVTTDVLDVDLSTSTKDVIDPNGGDADPGDVLRYTVSIVESSGVEATGVQVTDDLPANLTGFNVVSIPPGATDASILGGGGANGTGFLDIQNITVPASGTVDIVFEATIASGTAAGTVLSNTANILPVSGVGATPSSLDVVVSASSLPSSGTKQLYLSDPSGGTPRGLSRVAANGLPPTATTSTIDIFRGNSETWTLSQALAAPLTLNGDDFAVELFLRRNGSSGTFRTRNVRIDIASASLGAIASTTQSVSLNGSTNQLITFVMSPGANLPATLPTGDTLTLTVNYLSGGNSNARIRVTPSISGTGNSLVELNATTVINVDSVDFFDAPHPGGSTPTDFAPNDTVTIRSVVSDPFGAFDISGATVEIFEPSGTSASGPSAMSEIVALATASTKTYEAQFALGAAPADGSWSARVVASEGDEGTITHTGIGAFEVDNAPDLVVFKMVAVEQDGFNTGPTAKAIPLATAIYTIGVSNQGPGPAGNVVAFDDLPDEVELYVDDYITPGPIYFVPISSTGGMSVNFTTLDDLLDDVEFDDGSGAWILEPVPDVDGFDESVEAIRINTTGTLPGSTGTPPSFELRFRVRIK
ncbi:MAG: hypothetical protein AB8G23_18965 [Myxococcota bacterium]